MEGMKKQAQELIEQAYKRGFKDGRRNGIEEGRYEAWEALKKISEMEGYKLYDIFKEFSASEVVEKLRAYEKRMEQEENKKIKVGDEI